ncbi:MAG: methyltransferase domain-containing protein [SAR202 cluster bacterium]|nr:methyltransferase domain-containing protein [SAR202 cluster bacterium]|tara:strand:+ start:5354 stop:5917 length:564 start_codon:yes stop_codon:yes gene_type:complete
MKYRMWFSHYMRHPLQLGALFPSSAALGSLMVKHIKPNVQGHILELGPGTGSFTRALIQKGIPENKLVLLERSPEFTSLLQESFPSAKVICGNARNLSEVASELGINTFEQIVSGLPLTAMGPTSRYDICDSAFTMLESGGSFVQVTYFPRCSIPNNVITAHSARKTYCGITLRNAPPAFVWRAEKR